MPRQLTCTGSFAHSTKQLLGPRQRIDCHDGAPGPRSHVDRRRSRDPPSRTELEGLLAAGDLQRSRSGSPTRLTFGTAGLRGPLRAGPNGMNVAVVRRAAAGLAAYLLQANSAAARNAAPHVVIGYDARHGSETSPSTAPGSWRGRGFACRCSRAALPTPVLAYAVRALGADAGVMVTASHNPPQDNGYKVYLGGLPGDPGAGAQIVPPQDREIEAAIAAAPAAAELPLSESYERLGAEVVDGLRRRHRWG